MSFTFCCSMMGLQQSLICSSTQFHSSPFFLYIRAFDFYPLSASVGCIGKKKNSSPVAQLVKLK